MKDVKTMEKAIKGHKEAIEFLEQKKGEMQLEIDKKNGPKYKIGDYIVEPAEYNNLGIDEYNIIYSIQKRNKEFIYNIDYGYNKYACWLVEKEIRKPTKEELEIYFNNY